MKTGLLLYFLLVLPWLIASHARVRALFGPRLTYALIFARALLLLSLLAGIAGFTARLPWGGEKATLFLLRDRSLSMELPVSGEDTTARAVASERALRETASRLDESWDIEEIWFGRRTAGTGDSTSLREIRGHTDLSASLGEVISRAGPGDRIVLFSDGRVTKGLRGGGPDPVPPVPVHAVIAAESLAVFDASIEILEIPGDIPRGESAPLPLAVAGRGPGEAEIDLELRVDGRAVESRNVRLAGRGTKSLLELTLPPLEEGFHRIDADVRAGGEELTLRNNGRSFLLEVKSGKRKLTLVSNAPDWDFAFLARQVASRDEYDAALHVSLGQEGPVVLRGAERYAAGAPGLLRDDIAASEVLVLHGDFPRLSRETKESVAARIGKGGAGVLLVPSLPWPGADSWGALSPLAPYPGGAELVGIAAGKVGRGASSSHAVLSLGLGSRFDEWEEIPPPERVFTGTRLAEGYVEVLELRDDAGLEVPLLIVKEEERARTAAILGKGLWRWDMFPVQFGKGPYFEMLASGLIEWLAETRHLSATAVTPVPRSLRMGEAVSFETSRERTDAREIRVEITGPAPGELRAVTFGREGETKSAEIFLPPGEYSYQAALTGSGETVPAGEGPLLVDDSSIEFDDPSPDAALLQSLCRRSGGSAVPLDDVDLLIQQLEGAAGKAKEARVLEVRREPGLYFALLALFFLELIVRRRKGLP